MTRRLPEPPLLVITDRATAAGTVIDVVAAALRGGCRWVMARDKDNTPAAREAQTRQIVTLCREAHALAVVNGDVALAQKSGADGVHLQAADGVEEARLALGEDALVGLSCHSAAEVRAAERAGADYVTLSPVFLTGSKPGYGPALGLDGLSRICARATVPVMALAGIDAGNASDCVGAGAAGVAVMGGIMRSTDPETTVRGVVRSLS